MEINFVNFKQAHSLIYLIVCMLFLAFLFNSCAKRPFVPVNEGREYGNPTTPWIVSHLPEANQWALARTKHHNVFQKIICFHYPCRKMIGRRKVLKAISIKKSKKRIKKNAKKGIYKNIRLPVPPPAIKEVKIDSVSTVQDTLLGMESKGVPLSPLPILKADSLITLNEFLFEVNSFKLKPEHFAELDLVSEFLVTHPTLEVSISGHTDNTGNEHHNLNLSLRRAEQVAQYLIDKGVMYEKIIFEGLGSTRPIAGNETNEGKSKNRRVEILIRNPKGE
jgi:outer membrane protein OmpA-like peptidoglycan-associated protein